MASATPDKTRVNPSSARRLKKPPWLWATVLRNDLCEGRRQDMERGKIVFFMFIGGLRVHIPQGSETLLPWSGGYPPATTAVFSRNLKMQAAPLVRNADCIGQAF